MKKLIPGMLMLTFISALVGVGCGGAETPTGDKPYEYKEAYTKIIELSGQTKLILINTNGGITIVGSDTTNQMHLEITKRVRSHSIEDAQEHIDDIEIGDNKRDSEVYVEVTHPRVTDRDYGADFAITLPTHFDFEITVGNGNIELKNVESAETEVGVGNGYIDVDMTLMDSCFVGLKVGNGHISADMTLVDTCSMEFQVGNGDITLNIPEDTDAEVKASVGNGEVSSGGLSFENPEVSRTELEGTLGDGRGNIVLSVGNGDIQLLGKPEAAAKN